MKIIEQSYVYDTSQNSILCKETAAAHKNEEFYSNNISRIINQDLFSESFDNEEDTPASEET